MKNRLIIAIPTWNRAAQLEQLLGDLSEVASCRRDFGLLISDNCSTDNTAVIVARYQALGLEIDIRVNSSNIGFDYNFLNLCSLCREANGAYIWVLGSDDRVNKKEFLALLSFLDSYEDLHGVITFNFQTFESSCPELLEDRDILDGSRPYSGNALRCAKILGGELGLLSQCLVRKALISEVDLECAKTFFSAGFSHLFLRWIILLKNDHWLHLPVKPLIYRRQDDLAKTLNPYDRVLFDAFAVLEIYKYLYYRNKRIGIVLLHYFSLEITRRLIAAMARGPVAFHKRLSTLQRIAVSYPMPIMPFYGPLYTILLVPSWFLRLIRKLKRFLLGGK